SFPMSSTGKLATTTEISVHIVRGAFPICHRPRKRTARAGFILAFIGDSIRRKGSPRVARWAITYSITLSGQRALESRKTAPSPVCFSLQKRHQDSEIV